MAKTLRLAARLLRASSSWRQQNHIWTEEEVLNRMKTADHGNLVRHISTVVGPEGVCKARDILRGVNQTETLQPAQEKALKLMEKHARQGIQDRKMMIAYAELWTEAEMAAW